MLITDESLLFYKRCRRRAFLDVYGNPTQRDSEDDFVLKLRQDSVAHRQAVLALITNSCKTPTLTPSLQGRSQRTLLLDQNVLVEPFSQVIETHQSPKYPQNNWDAGAKATLELMQQGIDCISQAVLVTQTEQGVTLVSRPDLLIKQSGASHFGNWQYVPVYIKLGRRPKPEYQMVAAFSAQILAAMQGVLPNVAWLILRRQDVYTVQLHRWIPQMQVILAECIDTLLLRQEPEVFISRQKCSLCHWYSSCYAIAHAQQHLSLLPGVTPSRYQDLQTLDITTVEALAQTQSSTLEPLWGWHLATDLVQQAQATLQNQAMVRHQGDYFPVQDTENPEALQSCPISHPLPTAPVELYFDIEAEPELNLDYLLGVLVVDKQTDTKTFHSFFAEHPTDEAAIWQQFLQFMEHYPNAPIFHFSDYEVETVKRLARLYKTPYQHLKPLLARFVDVHHSVMKTVTVPVEGYSLKHLARWLGFEWRDAGVTGSQCVCLYNRWLDTGDRSLLDIIQRYNEDDCRATYHLKTWLVDFLQNTA